MKIIVVSISSDIGYFLAEKWLNETNTVIGTYRRYHNSLELLKDSGAVLVPCDLTDSESINRLEQNIIDWDVLVMGPATMEPIGNFQDVEFSEWHDSINVNFISQLEVVHKLLPKRNRSMPNGPVVIFFAGGGTNNAVLNYSAYTVSKIALIKMTELLDAEIPDTRFVIIGPGWVKTKIHGQTLNAHENAGANYQKTVERLQGDDFTDMNDIFECCKWIVDAKREIVSGRNFSVVHDNWGTDELRNELLHDQDKYKLRRFKN